MLSNEVFNLAAWRLNIVIMGARGTFLIVY